MKKIVFIGLFLFVSVFVWAIVSRQFKIISVKKFPVQTVLQNAEPLVWLDDQYMLVSLGNKIVKYNTNDDKNVNVVSDLYYPGLYECFSPDGGVFAIDKEKINYHWIQDWNYPTIFKEQKRIEWGNMNRLDCSHIDDKDDSSSKKIGTDVFNYDNRTSKLVMATDGDTKSYLHKSYLNNQKTEPQWERVILLKKNDSVKEINLGNTPYYSDRINASFDRTLGKYFWYTVTESFDDDNEWPIKGWWVAPSGEILEDIKIPGGPWIRHFSFFYQLRFFSCGPECYSHMKMYVGNGNIYIYVYGEAVDDSVHGVYRLDINEQKWDKLIAETIESGLAISPSGCQISYAANSKMKIMNVCKK